MQQIVANLFKFIALICLYLAPSIGMASLFYTQQHGYVLTPVAFWLLNIGILSSFVLVLAILFVVYQRSFPEYSYFQSFTWRTPFKKSKLLASIPYAVAMLLLSVIFNALMTWFTGQEYQDNTANQQAIIEMIKLLPAVTMIFNIVIFAPIGEELLFRGILFHYVGNNFQRTWQIIALLLSASIFAFMHLAQFDAAEFCLYACMGLILGTLYWRSRDLRYSILVHIVNNIVGVTNLYLS